MGDSFSCSINDKKHLTACKIRYFRSLRHAIRELLATKINNEYDSIIKAQRQLRVTLFKLKSRCLAYQRMRRSSSTIELDSIAKNNEKRSVVLQFCWLLNKIIEQTRTRIFIDCSSLLATQREFRIMLQQLNNSLEVMLLGIKNQRSLELHFRDVEDKFAKIKLLSNSIKLSILRCLTNIKKLMQAIVENKTTIFLCLEECDNIREKIYPILTELKEKLTYLVECMKQTSNAFEPLFFMLVSEGDQNRHSISNFSSCL